MKSTIFLICLLSLAACAREKGKSVISTYVPSQSVSVSPPKAIVYFGQSNSSGLYVNGDAALRNSLNGNYIGINCGHSWSTIQNWQPGYPQYEACLAQVKERGIPVAGIVAWQGESESLAGPASTWSAQFTNAMESFRTAIGNTNAPVVFVRLSTQISPAPFINELRQQQESVNLPNSKMVDIDSIAIGPDLVHYTTAGYVSAAVKLGDALAGLMK